MLRGYHKINNFNDVLFSLVNKRWFELLHILVNDGVVDISEYISKVSAYFDIEFEKEWLTHDFVKKVIKNIDNSQVIEDELLKNEVIGYFSQERLSSGCKALILIYELNLKVSGDRMGDNCIPYLLELAEQKEVYISLRHIPEFPQEFNAVIENTNKNITSFREFVNEYVRLV